MTFRIGMKVACIHEPKSAIAKMWMERGAHYPTKDSVYTIRKIVEFSDRSSGVLLSELINDHMGFAIEPAFGVEHFRPIVERKTSIEIFTRMLTDQKVDA